MSIEVANESGVEVDEQALVRVARHVLDRLGGTPARPRAARTALPPSSTADSPASTPPNLPMGVLAPAQITGCARSNMDGPPSPSLVRVYRPG